MATFKPVCTALFFTFFLVACAAIPEGALDSQAAYKAAISDAAVASPSKILPLQALPAGDRIAVVSWVSERKTPCAKDTLPCEVSIGKNPVWVTLSGEVQTICRAWNLRGDALRRRLEQLLGMPMDPPPQYRMVAFAEYAVPRDSIERPCLGVDETNPAHPTCTIDAQPGTPIQLRTFVGQQMAESYVVDNPKGPGYPYTRLGYTYDWAPTANAKHYGATEFIIKPMSATRVFKVIPTDDYCAAE